MAPASAVHSEQAAIRHGLQAGPSQPHLSAVDKAPSGAGGSAPSDSPLGWTLQSIMNASLHATLTAPNPVSEVGSAESEVMEAVLTELMADEVVVLELQNVLGSLPAQPSPETVAAVSVAQQRVIFHGVQGAVDSTASYTTPPETPPQADPEWLTDLFDDLNEGISEGGAGSERQSPHLPVGFAVVSLWLAMAALSLETKGSALPRRWLLIW